MTLLLTVVIFLCVIAMLAIGVVFAHKPVKTSCCAASKLDKTKGAETTSDHRSS